MRFVLRVYLFFIVCFLFSSCNDPDNNSHVSPRYVVLAEEMLKQMEKKLSKKYPMQVISDRAGLADRVNLLGLGFQIHGPLTQDELRVILVGCVEEFLSAINSNEEIRPYLKTYPFTAEGVQIDIFVVDSRGREVFDPYISIANALQGKLEYKTIDREDIYKYKSKVVETYAEALKIVNSHELK